MTAVSYVSALFHADDDSGAPLVGGKLYTYVSGTTTPAITYADDSGSTQNTNPVTLNARGEAQVFLTTGNTYSFALYTASGALIYTIDGVSGPLSSAALSAYAPLEGPTFTGNPTAPTQLTNDNSTKLATTALVKNKIDAALVDATEIQKGIIELATNAEVIAGTDAERAIVAAALFNLFTGSGRQQTTGPYYFRLPGKFVVQFGKYTGGGSGDVTITLPYSNNASVLFAGGIPADISIPTGFDCTNCKSTTATTFTLARVSGPPSAAGAFNFYWLAITLSN